MHPHILFMSEVRRQAKTSCDDGHTWRVVDDLARDCPVTPAELDAVEAFLMPLVHALLADALATQPGKTNPDTPPIPMPTHKRRNELLPEEI
jgi:hypothetical protein